jgi:hypothetical protein
MSKESNMRRFTNWFNSLWPTYNTVTTCWEGGSKWMAMILGVIIAITFGLLMAVVTHRI